MANQNDQHEAQVLGLIYSLLQTAMMQMGKMPHPLTDKCERDLAGAGSTIDLLLALQAKTKGNLSPREAGLLQDALTSLQLTFVQEKANPGGAESAPPEPPPPAEKSRIIIP